MSIRPFSGNNKLKRMDSFDVTHMNRIHDSGYAYFSIPVLTCSDSVCCIDFEAGRWDSKFAETFLNHGCISFSKRGYRIFRKQLKCNRWL